MSSNYFVKLEKFEGPLDLLLYLIKVNELEIFDIDLFKLTQQYLEYLRLMKFRDLGDAAAFMEMAASLCEIKSTHLIPSDKRAHLDTEIDEESQAMDLQQRLIDYDTFKSAALELEKKLKFDHFVGKNSEWKRLSEEYSDCEAPLRGDTSTLLILYEQMLGALSERRPTHHKALKEQVTVAEVIQKIKDYIEQLRFCLFQELYSGFETRYELVANILAVLQLVRDRELKIHQETFLGPLWLYDITLSAEQLPLNPVH